MFKQRLLLACLTMVAISLMLTGGTGASPDRQDIVTPTVPVTLDGVRYDPEEFDRIHKELHSKGVFLAFWVDHTTGDLMAETEEYSIKQGRGPFPRPVGKPDGRVVKSDDGVIQVLPPE